MNDAVMKALSPSAQNALRVLARTPGDASSFYDRVTLFRAALRIGHEVLEKNMALETNPATVEAYKFSAMATLGTITSLELCMGVIEQLYAGELRKEKRADDPPPKAKDPFTRFGLLELDP